MKSMEVVKHPAEEIVEILSVQNFSGVVSEEMTHSTKLR